ncbi:hypothetical protein LNP25_29900 [Klebsiella variicola subsp. variicola]|nr:hypothetical protein [Klebsiella variicola subsp. variicola]
MAVMPAGQRLAGRPGRGAQYLLHRHRAVYRRVAVLRQASTLDQLVMARVLQGSAAR